MTVAPETPSVRPELVEGPVRPIQYETDLSEQLARVVPSLFFEGETTDELRDWQGRFREKLLESMWTPPERGPLDLRLEDEVDCGAYVRRRATYQSEAGVWVPAWLLVPKAVSAEQQAPGVLFLHGHSDFGKDNVARIATSPERRAELDRFKMDFGPTLAEAGFVVLAPDLRGFGERCVDYPNPRTEHCPRNFMVAALMGTTVVAQHACDLTAALDVLEALPFVDGRLACAGLSLGGRMTMLISALDARVQVAVPSGCLNLFQERYQALRQCGAQLFPGLIRYGDTPEIFSLIAPRHMVIEWGQRDPLIPHDWAERGLARIERAYAAAGVPARLMVDRFDGEHQFHGTLALDTLLEWKEGTLP